MDERFTVGVVVRNDFGVLNRVAGLFAKRCYNIDSLAVGVTENPKFSRITIVSTGDEYKKEQVVRQLQKLHDVKLVALLDGDSSVSVEHVLAKMCVDGETSAEISDLINEYGGKVMDFSSDFITAEITGTTEKIDKFILAAKNRGILEICRSGGIAMAHGTENMLSIKDL
ncbi:MAG: acetolactate synthase small subunit, partial [Clostridia bacterium]